MEKIQKYVPSKLVDIEKTIPGTELQQEKAFVDTLVGGDLLSAVRARGAIDIRSGSELLEHRLRGFRIVSEDWYALVCYLEVHTLCNSCSISSHHKHSHAASPPFVAGAS